MTWKRVNRRRSMRWAALSLAAVLASPFAAAGQMRTSSRQYTGTAQADINVGIFATIRKNCTAGPLPTIRLASPPAHGKLTVKQGHVRATNIRQCLATDLPAFVAFYSQTGLCRPRQLHSRTGWRKRQI